MLKELQKHFQPGEELHDLVFISSNSTASITPCFGLKFDFLQTGNALRVRKKSNFKKW